MEKSQIYLKTPIGSGGEANIYEVRLRPDLVAKIYHKPNTDYARKLQIMIANPPDDPLTARGLVSIAWAVEPVTDLGQIVGFLMPKLDLSQVKPIFYYYNPSMRRKDFPWFNYERLLRTAQNLATAVSSVHSRGYAIGDVNESNILVSYDAIVTLVDTDSFQVSDGSNIYRCTVGKPEYTPPELQGLSFRDVDRFAHHDLFGLGVLIFQLLMEGIHPFGGVYQGQGESPELKDRIKSGHFPHGMRSVPYKPMPTALSFHFLPPYLQELFRRCFEDGHRNPAARPTAKMWSAALGEFAANLSGCSVNPQHRYGNHLSFCPWCERAAKLGGRDPFPSKQAVSSNQHLKPAAIVKAIEKPILKVKSKPPTTSKVSILNPTPSSVITPKTVTPTPQKTSQPKYSLKPKTSQASISSNVITNNSQIVSSPTSKNPQISPPPLVIANPTATTQLGSSYWSGLGISFGIYAITGIFLAFTKQSSIVWILLVIQTVVFSLSSIIKFFLEILNIWLRGFILTVIGIYITLSTSFIYTFFFDFSQLKSSESQLIIASGAIVWSIAFCMGALALIGNAKTVINSNTWGFIAVTIIGFIGSIPWNVESLATISFIILFIVGWFILESGWSIDKLRIFRILEILRIPLFCVCVFAAAYIFSYIFICTPPKSSYSSYLPWLQNSLGFHVLTSTSAMLLAVLISSALAEEGGVFENSAACGCGFCLFFIWGLVTINLLALAGAIGFGVFSFGVGLCILAKTAIIENKELEKYIVKWKAKLVQLGICLSGLSIGLLIKFLFLQ